MTNDPLKAAWQQAKLPARSDLSALLRTRGGHPVMSRIRRQLILEGGCYVLFLLVYYDFFDGHTRPLYLNIILVLSVACMLVQHINGYLLAAGRLKAPDILQSLQLKVRQLQQYAWLSVGSRVLGWGGILLFFCSGINWTTPKYWLLAGITIAIVIQMVLLWQLWQRRINRINDTLLALKE
ncbi:hypothetical protein HF329_28795 [Chitinophaga oryzae]|uniref:Uncharacterized protein n=1 Tax=Chitinophaga oryzae TaxID=2725414 RepID=A0AAE7DA96_9BACT|nr:hypothetical protein [Chitinophaga oryzae]QJB35087.1 hypothetical protein HF329_28795 [Chitinophaga oryzae]